MEQRDDFSQGEEELFKGMVEQGGGCLNKRWRYANAFLIFEFRFLIFPDLGIKNRNSKMPDYFLRLLNFLVVRL